MPREASTSTAAPIEEKAFSTDDVCKAMADNPLVASRAVRTVEPEEFMEAIAARAPDYPRAIDQAVAEACGVGYSELVETSGRMDPEGRLLEQAEAKGVPPGVFAEAFLRSHGLARADAVGPDDAAAINLRRAALGELAAGKRSRWEMAEDGTVSMPTEMGALTVSIVKQDGQYGFAACLPGEEPKPRLDIGDAVTDAIHRLRIAREAGFVAGTDPEAGPGMGMH